MSTAIYYFSGTGNSLHGARELQKRLPESRLMPIVRMLSQESIKTTAETVGFVFPNFCMSVPIPLHDFLEKVDLASAQYIFAVCTRGGTSSEAFDYINEILGKQGKQLDAQINITMPWNHCMGEEDLPATATRERIEQLEAEMQDKLDPFSEHVLAHEEYIRADTDANFEVPGWIEAMTSLIPRSFNYELHRYEYQDLIRFYSDSNCTGCGICEEVCLSSKIELFDNRSVWRDSPKCYGCFACINFCPQQAIQIRTRLFLIKSSTATTTRYHHESVTYKDIAQQK